MSETAEQVAVQTASPEVEAMVREMIGRVADKWTLLVLEALEEHGRMRFTQIGEALGEVSQKMLTQTLRRMEADGLVERTVYPVVPPHVEYALTEMGLSLSYAFCGVWTWVETHREAVTAARERFAKR